MNNYVKVTFELMTADTDPSRPPSHSVISETLYGPSEESVLREVGMAIGVALSKCQIPLPILNLAQAVEFVAMSCPSAEMNPSELALYRAAEAVTLAARQAFGPRRSQEDESEIGDRFE